MKTDQEFAKGLVCLGVCFCLSVPSAIYLLILYSIYFLRPHFFLPFCLIRGLFIVAVSKSHCRMISHNMGRKRYWSSERYNSAIFLHGLRKTTKKLGQGIWHTGQVSKQEPTKR